MMKNESLMIIISAPAGTGKGTIVRELAKRDNIEVSVSATTRKPREKDNEKDGVNYHFITKEQFRVMIEEDGFLEYAEYCDNYYGTPKKPVERWKSEGKDVIFEIEVQGYKKLKEIIPECISIFIMPPSMEELEKRLRKRGTETEEEIQKRLKTAVEEMKTSDKYDYTVVNDTVEQCVEDVLKIIEKAKA